MIATLELAHQGGYEAIQMREVAARSGVALGTAYTYFQSRDNLAYRAAIAWTSLLAARADEAARADLSPDARHVDALRHFTRTLAPMMHAHPRMLETWVRSIMSSDPLVVAAQRGIDWSYWMRVMPHVSAEHSDQVRARLGVLRDVLYAGLVRWAFDQDDLDRVSERTFAALEMIFAGSADHGSTIGG
jgi:AcrR family transcriptional regulator